PLPLTPSRKGRGELSHMLPPRFVAIWLAIGASGLLILPWYGLETGISPPALFTGAQWLWPLVLPLLLCLARPSHRLLIACGAAGLLWLVAEALLIGQHGWSFAPGTGPVQQALGWGAIAYALACLMLLAYGLARLGVCKGDVFVVSSILLV